MDTTEFNEWASRKVWSALPEKWEGYGKDPKSQSFAKDVRRFQRRHSLVVDGKLGEKTWEKMQEVFVEGTSPPIKEIFGVDVARWQGDVYKDDATRAIDWKEVAADGKSFAIIKGGEGVGYDRNLVREHASGVKTAGLRLMYYHFGTPHYADVPPAEDARREAAYFIETLSVLPHPSIMRFASGRMANVWVDLEKSAKNLNRRQGLIWCQEFLRRMEWSGKWLVGLYTSDDWLEDEVFQFSQLLRRPSGDERPIWVARYGPNDGTMPDPDIYDPDAKVPEAWGTWDIWQFTSRAKVPGIEKECDVNVARIPA